LNNLSLTQEQTTKSLKRTLTGFSRRIKKRKMINLTHHELCEELEKLDEVELLELLDVTSEELVEKFQDKIEDNFDKLIEEVDNLKEEIYTDE
jgi:hypothetical protein